MIGVGDRVEYEYVVEQVVLYCIVLYRIVSYVYLFGGVETDDDC